MASDGHVRGDEVSRRKYTPCSCRIVLARTMKNTSARKARLIIASAVIQARLFLGKVLEEKERGTFRGDWEIITSTTSYFSSSFLPFFRFSFNWFEIRFAYKFSCREKEKKEIVWRIRRPA